MRRKESLLLSSLIFVSNKIRKTKREYFSWTHWIRFFRELQESHSFHLYESANVLRMNFLFFLFLFRTEFLSFTTFLMNRNKKTFYPSRLGTLSISCCVLTIIIFLFCFWTDAQTNVNWRFSTADQRIIFISNIFECVHVVVNSVWWRKEKK